MNRTSSLTAIFLAALSVGLAVKSGQYFYTEYKYALSGFSGPSPSFEALGRELPDIPKSSRARLDVLNSCLVEMQGVDYRLRPRRERDALDQTCANFATATIGADLELAEAWTVLAKVHLARGQTQEAIAAIATSHDSAPSNQWLAAKRVEMSRQLFQAGVEINFVHFTDDVGIMLASRRGIQAVVDLYIAVPALRETIVSATRGLDPESRSRFLNRLRSTMKS